MSTNTIIAIVTSIAIIILLILMVTFFTVKYEYIKTNLWFFMFQKILFDKLILIKLPLGRDTMLKVINTTIQDLVSNFFIKLFVFDEL